MEEMEEDREVGDVEGSEDVWWCMEVGKLGGGEEVEFGGEGVVGGWDGEGGCWWG